MTSGTLPDFEPQPPQKPQGQFAVKIVFDGDQSRFPIGAQGAAAVYTGGKHGGWAAMRRIGNGAAHPAGLQAKKLSFGICQKMA